MYILRQTTAAPLQCNFCGNGLTNIPSAGYTLANVIGGTPVYISPDGTGPSVYINRQGTLSYTFTKSGKTSGTSSGTAISTTSFTDSTPTAGGTTTYTLVIKDANTGQQYTYINSIVWGPV
jgi:hypothetical protein